MEVLCFNVSGKLAHFRKYYANNTAFSFTIPPRTTLMGMVAAAMGWERDSYYEKLASEKIHFGVRVMCPLKKSFHRLNFLSIKKLGDLSKSFSSDFRGEGGRIQTPFEVVSGWDLLKNDVVYQVFISPTEDDSDVFENIKDHFIKSYPVFNISFGVANFNAYISNIVVSEAKVNDNFNPKDYVLIYSAIPSTHVKDLKFDKEDSGGYNFVEEDMMPGDFVSNESREVRKMNRLLFSTSENPLRLKINEPPVTLNLPEGKIDIQFMDV